VATKALTIHSSIQILSPLPFSKWWPPINGIPVCWQWH